MLEIIALMKPVQLNDNSVNDAIDTPAFIQERKEKKKMKEGILFCDFDSFQEFCISETQWASSKHTKGWLREIDEFWESNFLK